jgi:hypothetical protein
MRARRAFMRFAQAFKVASVLRRRCFRICRVMDKDIIDAAKLRSGAVILAYRKKILHNLRLFRITAVAHDRNVIQDGMKCRVALALHICIRVKYLSHRKHSYCQYHNP